MLIKNMKKFLSIIAIAALLSAPAIVFADRTGTGTGGGGGSAGGTWATTTSSVVGRLINYSNNNTDIVCVGDTATSSCEYWFDPNTPRAYISGTTTFPNVVGIATTSPLNGTTLDVGGRYMFRIETPTGVPGAEFNFSTATSGPPVPHRSALQIVSGDGDFGALYIDSVGGRPIINLRHAGGSWPSPTPQIPNEELGRISWRGFNDVGGFTGSTVSLSAYAAEDFSTTTQGSFLVLKTTALGTVGGGTGTIPPEVVRIQPSGGVSIGDLVVNTTDLGHGSLYTSGPVGFSSTSPSARVAITASSTLANASRLLAMADSSNAEQFVFETDGDLKFGTTTSNFAINGKRVSIGATSSVSTLGLACTATTTDICFGVTNGVGNPIMNLLGRGALVIGSTTVTTTGTVNPLLSLNSNNASQLVFEATSGNNTATAGVRFDMKRCRTSVTGCTAVQSGDRIGALTFFGHNGTAFTQDAQIIVVSTGTPSTRSATIMSFNTSNTSASTESFRITSSQDIAISNGATIIDTSPARLYIDNEVIANANSFMIGPASDTTLSDFIVKQAGNVGVATTSPWRKFSVNGTVSLAGLTLNTGAATASLCLSSTNEVTRNTDAETCIASSGVNKENIKPLSPSLADILKLQPVTFDYKDGSGKDKIGLIAEDVAAVNTHLVSTDENGSPSGIRWSHITTMLVSSVQEIVAKVTGLEEKIKAQDETIKALDARLKALEK